MPQLRRLLIGDPPAAWAEAGFAIEHFWKADGPTEDAPPDFGLILARRV